MQVCRLCGYRLFAPCIYSLLPTSGSLAAKLPEDIIYFSFATDGSKAFLGVLPSFFAAKATSSIYIFCALANTSAAWSIPNLVAYFAAADSPFWV